MAEKSAYERLVDTLHGWQQATSPWNIIGPQDVAGMAPGGGLVQAVEPFAKGTQKTAAARQAFSEGRYGDALTNYASGFLDTANAGASALPEVGPLMPFGGKLAAAIAPGSTVRAWHGSPNKFDAFDLSHAGSTRDPGELGRAHYFSTDRTVAEGTTDKFGTYGAAPHKYEADLTLNNPLNLEMRSWSDDKRKLVSDALGIPTDLSKPATAEWAQQVADELRKRGHDSVALDYEPLNYNHHEIAVLGDDGISIKRRY